MARQRQLEESASHLACFQAAESQLRPWLMEKELMMGVLGPLSIDPNMLNAQKQQVQVSSAAECFGAKKLESHDPGFECYSQQVDFICPRASHLTSQSLDP